MVVMVGEACAGVVNSCSAMAKLMVRIKDKMIVL